jgi:hypothetical protein
MGDPRIRPQARKSAESRRKKQHEDAYMKQESHESEHINHSGRRRQERMEDQEWEGVWNKGS